MQKLQLIYLEKNDCTCVRCPLIGYRTVIQFCASCPIGDAKIVVEIDKPFPTLVSSHYVLLCYGDEK